MARYESFSRRRQSTRGMEEEGESDARLDPEAVGRSERLSSETRAEVAREFRKTLNRNRPSRKRYSFSIAHLSRQQSSHSSSLESSVNRSSVFTRSTGGTLSAASSFERDGNPFVSSVAIDGGQFGGGDGVPLGTFEVGGDAIYREFEEYESLSRIKNGLKKIIPQPLRMYMLPPRSWKEWQKFLFTHLPIIHWLWTYRPQQLTGDIIAGITIGVTHIPQGYFCISYI